MDLGDVLLPFKDQKKKILKVDLIDIQTINDKSLLKKQRHKCEEK